MKKITLINQLQP